MKRPDKRSIHTGEKSLKPKEGAWERLSGDTARTHAPSLVFNPNSQYISEDAAIDYLAQILVEIYLDEQNDAAKKSSDLLSGLDKGAS